VIKLIHIKQWVKNDFVLAPLRFSDQITDAAAVRTLYHPAVRLF
jgi:hypothetical protein